MHRVLVHGGDGRWWVCLMMMRFSRGQAPRRWIPAFPAATGSGS